MNQIRNIIFYICLGSMKYLRLIISRFQGELCVIWMRLCGVVIVQHVKVRGWCFIWRNPKAQIILKNNVTLSSGIRENPVSGANRLVLIAAHPNACLEIGVDTAISASVIYASKSIIIGNRVMIGAGCSIYDTNFHSLDHVKRFNGNIDIESAPVFIEDDVWLGAQVMVLKGVRIGKGSVIAARSVVTNNIPEGVLAAGTPAHVIRNLNL